jgi:hypothetical protein
LDQGLENGFIDLPQSHDPETRPKRMKNAHVGHAVAMPQAGEAAPSSLFGQHLAEQIERMHWRQQRQQMDPPQLRGAEPPAWTTRRASAPLSVDKIVGHIGIEQIEQARRAGHRKTFHGAKGYPFENDASAFCWRPQLFSASSLYQIT